MKGPAEARVSTKPAALTAANKVENLKIKKSGKLSRLEQFNFGGFLAVQQQSKAAIQSDFEYNILFVHKF